MSKLDEFLRGIRFNLGIKGFLTSNFLVESLVKNVLNRRRMKLPTVDLTEVTGLANTVSIRTLPLNHWDTPYGDIVAICAIAKTIQPRTILEIGTARGRTTLLLADNCPEAVISTYDIDPNAGAYFRNLSPPPRIELKICDVHVDRERLKAGPKFDLIFIDANHTFDAAKADSDLALELLAPGGAILWHDYDNSGYLFGYNAVPEVLAQLAVDRKISGIQGTAVAFYRSPSR